MANYKLVDADKLDADLSIVADAIRSKGGTSERLPFPYGFKEAVEKIGGGNDNILYNFAQATQIFFSNNEEIENIEIDCKGKSQVQFRLCTNLKRIVMTNTESITNYNYLTNGCVQLESLETLDFSSITSNVGDSFLSDSSVFTHLRVVPNTIGVTVNFKRAGYLDEESIQSIIDGLKDLSDESAQTITLNSKAKEKLTEEQIATITCKNWTLA